MAIDYSQFAISKGEPRKRVKARAQRAEKKVKDVVRAKCVERDGDCRAGTRLSHDIAQAATYFDDFRWDRECRGESEWAHMHERRRSKTRGMAPEVRHDTAYSLMLCTRHHDQYDGRQSPRLFITALTRDGANGALKFRRGK